MATNRSRIGTSRRRGTQEPPRRCEECRQASEEAGDENDLAEARRKVNIAKHGLGERGEYWWEMAVEDRERRAEESLRELR